MININEVTEITLDLIEYYKTNLDKAQKDYLTLTANSRGLDKSKLAGYYEKHHIIPRCMGGLDEDSNYVLLTYREHVLAHVLLSILNPESFKLKFALNAMINLFKNKNSEDFTIDLKFIEQVRYEHSLNWSANNPTKTPKAIFKQSVSISGENNPAKRLEVKEKISLSMRGDKNPMKNTESLKKIQKRIIDSNGNIYPSITDAAKDLNMSRTAILNRIKSNKGFKYLDSPRKNKQKVIDVDGIIYPSIRECARVYNVGKTTIKNWIENFPEKGFKYYD